MEIEVKFPDNELQAFPISFSIKKKTGGESPEIIQGKIIKLLVFLGQIANVNINPAHDRTYPFMVKENIFNIIAGRRINPSFKLIFPYKHICDFYYVKKSRHDFSLVMVKIQDMETREVAEFKGIKRDISVRNIQRMIRKTDRNFGEVRVKKFDMEALEDMEEVDTTGPERTPSEDFDVPDPTFMGFDDFEAEDEDEDEDEDEAEDEDESENDNEDYVKEKKYKIKKKGKDREKNQDNIVTKELNQNKCFKKRTSAPLISDLEKEKEKYSKKKKSNYFNIHQNKGNEDRIENEKQNYDRIKSGSMEKRKIKNKNINTDDPLFDNNLNICRKQESQKILNVSLKREKNKKEFYIQENIFELHQDCDALKDFLNKKNEKIKESKNLFKKYKTESYIVNGSDNYFNKENNQVESNINNNNNFSINVKQEELFVEKTNSNSKTKSLIDLYGADEDYYNQYYYDDIYLLNKNNNKKSSNNNANNINTNNNNNDLCMKEITSNSSQEYMSLSSKSNGLYSKKQSSQCLVTTEIKKINKVKINTEIDILKYNRSERMSEYTPRKEEAKGKKSLSKSRNKKKKEGILKNKNGRSRTLVLKSSPKDIEEKNLNIKKEIVIGRTISSNTISNNLDLSNNVYNRNNLFINNNEFNKEKIKQLLENKINKNEMKNKKDKKKKNHDNKIDDIMLEKEKDDIKKKEKEREKKMLLKKLQEKNKLYDKEYLDYEIDYSSSRRNNKDDFFEEQIEKNDKKLKKKKYKVDKKQNNKNNAVIYF